MEKAKLGNQVGYLGSNDGVETMKLGSHDTLEAESRVVNQQLRGIVSGSGILEDENIDDEQE